MAFKKVTAGLTDINAVINEIVTFMTTDLPAPWTLELNKNSTAANGTDSNTGTTGRSTWLSAVPSDPKSRLAFLNSRAGSPSPTRMYIGMRNVTTPGIQVAASGRFPNSTSSPLPAFFGASAQDGVYMRGVRDGRTSIAPKVVNLNSTGPYTALYCFGPQQSSPLNPSIPQYVYFVLEFSPGRFVHFHFGEMRKFVPFVGGWGVFPGSRDASDTVDAGSNGTLFNDMYETAAMGALAADIGQAALGTANAASPITRVRWFLHTGFSGLTPGSSTIASSTPAPLFKIGHGKLRDYMTGPSRALLSGFTPLVTPAYCLGDFSGAAGPADRNQLIMPACYPEDFWLGDITNFSAGVEVTVGGIPIIPFPITATIAGSPRSTYGGYFYRKRV